MNWSDSRERDGEGGCPLVHPQFHLRWFVGSGFEGGGRGCQGQGGAGPSPDDDKAAGGEWPVLQTKPVTPSASRGLSQADLNTEREDRELQKTAAAKLVEDLSDLSGAYNNLEVLGTRSWLP